MTVELTLPLMPPSINELWQIAKNHKTGKAFLRRSDKYEKWRTDMIPFAKRKGCIVGPYVLTVQLQRPSARADIDNYAFKAINDVLADAGVIGNDCHCEMLSARWVTSGEGVYVRLDPAGVE